MSILLEEELNNKVYGNGLVDGKYRLLQNQNLRKMINKLNQFHPSSSGRVDEALKWLGFVLLLIGRSPFSRKTFQSENGLDNPIPRFSHSFKTIFWLYFTITSILIAFVLLMCTIGFANFFLDWAILTKSDVHQLEKICFRKNLVPFVLYWGILLNLTVGNVGCWTNRKKYVDYLNDWNDIVDMVNIDLPSSLKRFLLYSHLWLLSFLFVFAIFFVYQLAPVARSISALIANLVLRPFYPDLYLYHDVHPFSLLGMVVMLYGVYGATGFLFLYVFECKLLRHSFKVWNRRLREQIFAEPNEQEAFLCEKLYRDHYLLVKMVKQTDKIFGSILQSIYSTQIVSTCFEMYYLARSGQFGSDKIDILVATVLFAQTFSYFFTLSLEAAFVNEAAMKGFEILRSRGFLLSDSGNKKQLIYSLEMSYSQRIVLTGGKFFSLDRPFIVTVMGAVFTYFIIVMQIGLGEEMK